MQAKILLRSTLRPMVAHQLLSPPPYALSVPNFNSAKYYQVTSMVERAGTVRQSTTASRSGKKSLTNPGAPSALGGWALAPTQAAKGKRGPLPEGGVAATATPTAGWRRMDESRQGPGGGGGSDGGGRGRATGGGWGQSSVPPLADAAVSPMTGAAGTERQRASWPWGGVASGGGREQEPTRNAVAVGAEHAAEQRRMGGGVGGGRGWANGGGCGRIGDGRPAWMSRQTWERWGERFGW